ncbi:MAG: hypothetical protein ACTHU0_17225 [Kofleriaceae bacterium]
MRDAKPIRAMNKGHAIGFVVPVSPRDGLVGFARSVDDSTLKPFIEEVKSRVDLVALVGRHVQLREGR